jgi:hypothetical protein
MRAIDRGLREREGYLAVPEPLRKLLYAAYHARFINGQRLHKLMMRLGLGPGGEYRVGVPVVVARG